MSGRNSVGRRGSAMIEFCLLLPWYIFLFVGAFDFGFYSYGLIAATNAARSSAAYCSASSGYCTTGGTTGTVFTTMCTSYVIGQLKYMPNIGTSVTVCTASPLTVTISYPTPSTGCPDGNACVTAQIAYVTPSLVPIPGLLPGQLTITRTVTMRLSS